MANEQNLIPFDSNQNREEAKKNGHKGGIASGKARRERKSIADALRMVLDEPAYEGSMQTRLDAITIKAVKKMFDKPDIKDLKYLSEILGELKQTIQAEGLTLNIQSSEQGASNIHKLIDGE